MTNWIPEKEAAEKLGYNKDWFRRLVKAGTLSISYTCTNGRKYHYSEKDIKKHFERNAVMVY